ncbi:MAG: efflux RND transporter permease subunit [Candidatus Riflebacteria bacterium]|nr:efflux RND transporter permease subunit [Candidatus Riflebacteria bacterium]
MTLSEFSVRRPIGITMITCVIILFGIVSLTHLPIDLMPDITYPTISISATYENASPVEVETLLTRPIEQALSAVPGVEEVSSSSTEGRCQVKVTFTWGTDLDAAANDIRDRLDRILSKLPDGVDRPILRKFDLANFPILVLGAASELDPVQMLKVIEDQVKFRLERIPGVASVDIMGGQKREIHVNLNIERLKALKISPDQVVAKLKQENLSRPAGIIEAGNYEYIVRTPGDFYKIDQIKDIVIRESNRTFIRLGEVADVADRWEKVRQIVRVNGKPGMRLSVNKQSGKNTVEIADAILEEISKINKDIPQVKISTIVNSSKYIKESISNVSSSAVTGGLLAIIILMFFLADLRSTIIISLSIPISIVATFALMYYYDFTLNIMSLGGVALGIGMLVDNSIVVLENIFRRIELGEGVTEASISGSDEVFAPILASTLTTVAIFLPLLFVQGMTGLMFKQLSYIVSFSLMCSLFVAATLVPMMASQLLKKKDTIKASNSLFSFSAITSRIINFFLSRYLELLSLVLKWKKMSLFAVFALLAFTVAIASNIQTEFMPSADEGEVRVTAELEVGSRLSLVEEKILELEKEIRKYVPEHESIISNVGGGGGGGGGGHGVNRAEFRIPLVSKQFRKRSSAKIAADLRSQLAKVAGVKIRTREGQGLFIFRMGASSTDKVQIQIRGHNFDIADGLAKKLEEILLSIDGISDVRLSRETGVPERLISIDRKRASDQNVTVSKVAAFLETLLSGTTGGNFREGGDEYRILVKAKDPEKLNLEQIMDLTIMNTDNKPVAIRNLASVVSREGPMLVERLDQGRIVNVTADPGERILGEVLNEVQAKIKTLPIPDGFSISLAGDYEEQQKSFRELLFSFILAIILVYMVMAVQYESLRDPVIVMFTVPLSAIGVILALVLWKTTFNVQSFIGCIMLAGIVVNNSILLVDHANFLYREKGMALIPSLYEAGRDRFRPVLMTALTTILGLVPLAFGLGEGGEVQAPMARVVIGGLVCATFISLLIIPAVYAVFEEFWVSANPEKHQESLS